MISKRERALFISFFILIFVIYGQSLFGGFVFDDRGINEHKELLSSLDNIVQVVAYPYWTVEAGLYRPTTLLSYLFNIVLFGDGAFSFHLVNLLLYFGICALIYILLRRLFEKTWFAYLAALIFLVLPIHTEVVANITGRSELLALFFSLLTLLEFTSEKKSYWRAGLWLLLGLGAKETALAAIPLVLLILYFKKQKFITPATLGVAGGALIYILLRYLVLGPAHFLGVQTSLIENSLLFADTFGRVATALQILWMYVSKTFWPANLCSDYSYNQIPVLTEVNLASFLGGATLLTAVVAFFVFIKRQPIISFASAILLTSFMPISNIFFPIGTIAGERLFFFPSLGFAILAAWLLTPSAFGASPLVRGRLVGVFILLCIYAFISFQRQSVWMTEERLFTSAAECAPNSVLSLSNLGTVYYFRGEYDKAQEVLERSREIKPIYSKGLNNLGLVYWKQGRFEEAERMYLEALKQKYPYPGALENLVLLYASKGDKERAIRWYRIIHPNVDDSSLRNLF